MLNADGEYVSSSTSSVLTDDDKICFISDVSGEDAHCALSIRVILTQLTCDSCSDDASIGNATIWREEL